MFILIIYLYLKSNERMRWHQKYCLALIVPSASLVAPSTVPIVFYPALIIPFQNILLNKFLNKIAPKRPYNRVKNSPFFYLVSFSIVFVAPFNKKTWYLRDLTMFIISPISSFEITNAVVPELYIVLWIPGSIAEDAVNPNGIVIL